MQLKLGSKYFIIQNNEIYHAELTAMFGDGVIRKGSKRVKIKDISWVEFSYNNESISRSIAYPIFRTRQEAEKSVILSLRTLIETHKQSIKYQTQDLEKEQEELKRLVDKLAKFKSSK